MFTIDKMSRTPIYEQLIREFELCILSGDIPENGQLPSVRALSQELGVNPNTLQKAYTEIERRGLCYTVPGSGRFIAKDALGKLRDLKSGRLQELEPILASLRDAGVERGTVKEFVDKVYDQTGNNENIDERKVSEA